jgi:hypothetical protein
MTRALFAGAAAALALASTASAAPQTHSCGATRAGHGTAYGIRATGVGCVKARRLARACVRGRVRGWKVTTAPSPDDRDQHGLIGLDRGAAHVSFQIRGKGGCA